MYLDESQTIQIVNFLSLFDDTTAFISDSLPLVFSQQA
ncbi:hypothetical protein AsAng_0050920 [Aureispira anguillae]|uniref:Uncharacterized protein n=1 Tax=Aureispira anguillae TaxID=2864201 RepID=A0A915YK69_9BACT|nr:hypothetical protein AsAng_0050920 [Aureispira anguillae]